MQQWWKASGVYHRDQKDGRERRYNGQPYSVSYDLTGVAENVLSLFGIELLESSTGNVFLQGRAPLKET